MKAPKLLFESRKTLQTRGGRFLTISIITVLFFVSLSSGLKTYQVWDIYGAKEGSLFELVLYLKLISSAIAVICLVLLYWLWSWSALIWSFLASFLAILGFKMGLNPEILTSWDVLLPWVVLAATFIFETPFRRSSE